MLILRGGACNTVPHSLCSLSLSLVSFQLSNLCSHLRASFSLSIVSWSIQLYHSARASSISVALFAVALFSSHSWLRPTLRKHLFFQLLASTEFLCIIAGQTETATPDFLPTVPFVCSRSPVSPSIMCNVYSTQRILCSYGSPRLRAAISFITRLLLLYHSFAHF